jgi:hypothetical protein
LQLTNLELLVTELQLKADRGDVIMRGFLHWPLLHSNVLVRRCESQPLMDGALGYFVKLLTICNIAAEHYDLGAWYVAPHV